MGALNPSSVDSYKVTVVQTVQIGGRTEERTSAVQWAFGSWPVPTWTLTCGEGVAGEPKGRGAFSINGVGSGVTSGWDCSPWQAGPRLRSCRLGTAPTGGPMGTADSGNGAEVSTHLCLYAWNILCEICFKWDVSKYCIFLETWIPGVTGKESTNPSDRKRTPFCLCVWSGHFYRLNLGYYCYSVAVWIKQRLIVQELSVFFCCWIALGIKSRLHSPRWQMLHLYRYPDILIPFKMKPEHSVTS